MARARPDLGLGGEGVAFVLDRRADRRRRDDAADLLPTAADGDRRRDAVRLMTTIGLRRFDATRPGDRHGDVDGQAPDVQGERLLIVQLELADGRPDGEPVLVFDRMGAGRGDMVLVTNDGLVLAGNDRADTPGPLECDGTSRPMTDHGERLPDIRDVDAAVRSVLAELLGAGRNRARASRRSQRQTLFAGRLFSLRAGGDVVERTRDCCRSRRERWSRPLARDLLKRRGDRASVRRRGRR